MRPPEDLYWRYLVRQHVRLYDIDSEYRQRLRRRQRLVTRPKQAIAFRTIDVVTGGGTPDFTGTAFGLPFERIAA
jgi:hypothetical protein